MTNEAEALLRDALALPDEDRADVAAELLASLDLPVADDPAAVGGLWSQELERRAKRVLSGEAVGEDWSVVRQRLADELAGVSQQVRFVAEAAAELEDATRWYEQRHAGLGLAFLAAVDRAIESFAGWTRAGAPIDGLPEDLDVRRVPVSRFPYYVAYLITVDQIHVLAIAHDRRRPAYWSGRVVH